MKKAAMTPTPSNVGTTRCCGTRMRFSDTVGTVLIINSATMLIQTALR